MDITDLFDTVFNVNDVNGKRLAREKNEKRKGARRLFSTRLFVFSLCVY